MAIPVPKGPLAVRWEKWALQEPRAGALGLARVTVENAGTVTWRSRGELGIQLSYHWLDERGNAIVWDGHRAALPGPVAPGEIAELDLRVRAPIPPGRYRLALDLLDEGRFWFAELGNARLEYEVDVSPRIERRLAVVGGPVPDQEEPLVPVDEAEAVAYLAPGITPAPDWSRRVLDAHQEGYAVVAGSIDPESRRAARALASWASGGGRAPSFPGPLLCPSVVAGIELDWLDDIEGLPTVGRPREEPWLYDGRIALKARPGFGRQRG